MKPRAGDLEVLVGGNIRKRRESLGASQGQLAQRLRDMGWKVSGPMVVAIERGERALRLAEVFLLADALNVSAADLLTAPDDDLRRIAPHINFRDLQGRLTSPPIKQVLGGWEGLEQRRRAMQFSGRGKSVRGHFVGDESMNEAEQHAGHQLGIPPSDVVALSYELWGRTLSDERNARAAQRTGANATPRSRATIRSHVTRGLLGELGAKLSGTQDAGSTRRPSNELTGGLDG